MNVNLIRPTRSSTINKVDFKTGFLFTCFCIEIFVHAEDAGALAQVERAHLLRDNCRGVRTGVSDTLHLSVLPSDAPCTLFTSYNLLTDQDQDHRLKIKQVASNKIACMQQYEQKNVSKFDDDGIEKTSRYILHNTRTLLL